MGRRPQQTGSLRRVHQLNAPLRRQLALLNPWLQAPEQLIHGGGNVGVHGPALPAVHFNRHRKRWFGGALQHRFLTAPPPGLLIPEGDRLNAPHQIAEGGVLDQVGQSIAVGCGDENHTTFSDGARGLRLQLRADLIDHDDFGHVVFHRLDHGLVLQLRPGHLHAAGPTNRGVGDVAITGDLIARVDHNNAPLQLIGKHPGDLAQRRCLAHTRAPHQQQGLPSIQEVPHHGNGAEHGSAHPAGQTDHLTLTVANRADPVKRSFNSRPVVATELTEPGHHSR